MTAKQKSVALAWLAERVEDRINLSVRLPKSVVAQLDVIVAKYPVVGTRHALVRLMIRLGMETIADVLRSTKRKP